MTKQPEFDKKYKTVVGLEYTHQHYEMIEWVNKNSTGSVDMKIVQLPDTRVYFAFQDANDALIFKIRYSK